MSTNKQAERRIRYFKRHYTTERAGKAVLKIDHQQFSIGFKRTKFMVNWTRRQLAIALIRLVDKYRK